MDRRELIEELKRDEGVVSHAYKDSLGFLTIGVGRLIDQRKGGGLTGDEIDYLLNNDIERVVTSVRSAIPFFESLDNVRQRALCNMCFQLGIGGLLKFKKMIEAMSKGDWGAAYAQALDSTWAKQTPERARRIAGMILEGGRWE